MGNADQQGVRLQPLRTMKIATLTIALAVPGIGAAQTAPSYARDVAPIFDKSCVGCHTATAKMGGLDLSSFETLQQGGKKGPVVVPNKSADSRLYLMISGHTKPAMPMGGDPLAAGDIDTIRRWIDAGAKGPAAGEVISKSVAKAPDIKPRVEVKPQIFSLAYSPDGKTIGTGGFGVVRLWDLGARKVANTLEGHAEVVRALAFSKDGTKLAAAGGVPGTSGEVKVWDVAKGTVIATVRGHNDCIYAVAFSPDGQQIATSSYDRLIKLWNSQTGAELRTLKDHIDAIYTLAFTPDGKRLLSGAADRTVKVWDPATGERLYTLGEPADGVNSIALDPTGRLLAAGGQDKTIRIWALEAKSGRLLNTLIAHEDAILKLAWSPDGKLLASASADKTLKVFQVPDLVEVKSISPQPDWVNGIEFSPDGKSLAAGRYDGSLSLYETGQFRDLLELHRASR